MMKFKRIVRNSKDTVVHAVLIDKVRKRVELWRWAADAVGDDLVSKAILVREENYDDPTERFGILQRFDADARRLSKQAT